MKSVPVILVAAAISANCQLAVNGVNIPKPTAFNCAIDGSVVNALTGEPIARAHVTAQGPSGASASTDSSGKWNLPNVACTVGVLSATRPGFVPQTKSTGLLVSGSPVHDVNSN